MKLWKKVYVLVMALYLIVSGIVGWLVTEKNYNSLKTDEIYSCTVDMKRFNQNAKTVFRLQSKDKINEELNLTDKQMAKKIKFNIYDSCKEIIDGYLDSENFLEIRDLVNKRQFTTHNFKWNFARKDLIEEKKTGKRSYNEVRMNAKHYLFMSAPIDVDNKIIITMIRDITKLDKQRNDQKIFFLKMEMVGFIVFLLVTPILSRYISKPIEKLKQTTAEIASGSYSQRVNISSKDEIGELGIQFNKMAEEIELKIKLLESEGLKKQRFVDNLIHDLRTPLTSIIGYADFLRSTKYDEEVFYKGLNNIHSEGKRMLKMINRLMNMIILANENIIINDVKIDKLFRDVYSIMEIKLNTKNISLLIENTNLIIPVNYDLMKEVIINLIDNAFNASPEGSAIIIGAKIEKRKKYIYIRDNGKGMNEEEIDKILEPFYRIDKARSRKDGGAGLGLSICNEIIKGHGAQIKFLSEVGQGTEVRIIF